jgi:hypothetical protein
MTTFHTEFTKEEFLALPEFQTKQDAPKDKTPFLLKEPKRLLEQKENLLTVLEHLSSANATELSHASETKEVIKVMYYIRHKDGNITESGGYIRLNQVIQDLLRASVLKVGETDANGVLTIKTE